MPELSPSTLIVLSGKTGSGKTAILNFLSQQYPVINLEKIAMHKGSVFGSAGINTPQPSQHFFEKELRQTCEAYTEKPFIFTEQKPSSIGKRKIPRWFYKKMETGLIVRLQIPKTLRIENILKEYFDTEVKKQQIFTAINKLSERFSKEKLSSLQEFMLKKDYTAFVNEMLDYYDSSVQYRLRNKPFIEIFIKEEFKTAHITQQIIQELKEKGIMMS